MQRFTNCGQESEDAPIHANPPIEGKPRPETSEQLTVANHEDWALLEDLRLARAIVRGYRDAEAEAASSLSSPSSDDDSGIRTTGVKETDSESVSDPRGEQTSDATPRFGVPFLCASLGLLLGFAATLVAERLFFVFPLLIVAWLGFGVFLAIQTYRQCEPANNHGVQVG